jgi:hypothetical protein
MLRSTGSGYLAGFNMTSDIGWINNEDALEHGASVRILCAALRIEKKPRIVKFRR